MKDKIQNCDGIINTTYYICPSIIIPAQNCAINNHSGKVVEVDLRQIVYQLSVQEEKVKW